MQSMRRGGLGGGGGHTVPKSRKETPVDMFKYMISTRHQISSSGIPFPVSHLTAMSCGIMLYQLVASRNRRDYSNTTVLGTVRVSCLGRSYSLVVSGSLLGNEQDAIRRRENLVAGKRRFGGDGYSLLSRHCAALWSFRPLLPN